MSGAPRWKAPQVEKKPPSRIRPVSAKRSKLFKARAEVREAAIERDGRCAAAARGLLQGIECWGRAEVNEVIRRGQWSAGWLELDNTVVLCVAHHQWVTEHPIDAEELGLYARGAGLPIRKAAG